MGEKINILFLGGSKRVSIAKVFIQAGIEVGYEVNMFSYELNNFEPIASVGKIVPGLKWQDDQILNHLKKTIVEFEINIVVPFVDIATILCSKLKEVCENVLFSVSSLEINETMFDKKKSHSWFTDHKLNVPEIGNCLPFVAKPGTGSGGKGMYFVKTQAEKNMFYCNNNVTDFLIQRFVEGVEYSVDCYLDRHQQIVSIVPRKRLETINGEATRSVTERNEQIMLLSEKILELGAFSGPVTIQYIVEKDTSGIFVIEINPRLGSGVLTSIAAGANICKHIVLDYLNINIPSNQNWQENLLMVRAYQEFYFTCN
jgi:carbamoyl-phosphate synthase large subunit